MLRHLPAVTLSADPTTTTCWPWPPPAPRISSLTGDKRDLLGLRTVPGHQDHHRARVPRSCTGGCHEHRQLPAVVSPSAPPGAARPCPPRWQMRARQAAQCYRGVLRGPDPQRPYRKAYARARVGFFHAWCAPARPGAGSPTGPVHVAALGRAASVMPGCRHRRVKQQLAAISMLFDWLVVGQVSRRKPRRPGARAEA